MGTTGWLSRQSAELPPGHEWLSDSERRMLGSIANQRRRDDWLLGRWTAKAAVAGWLRISPSEIEILAARDGAPDAWVDGRPARVSVSLSHRAGRAVAAVADLPLVTGCDLELIEPRSDAFVREWLTSSEQRLVTSLSGRQRALLANLIWAAKEAAAKVRREGLRLNVRQAEVTAVLDGAPGGWRTLRVKWADDGACVGGWWRTDQRWVLVIAGASQADPSALLGAEALVDQPVLERIPDEL